MVKKILASLKSATSDEPRISDRRKLMDKLKHLEKHLRQRATSRCIRSTIDHMVTFEDDISEDKTWHIFFRNKHPRMVHFVSDDDIWMAWAQKLRSIVTWNWRLYRWTEWRRWRNGGWLQCIVGVFDEMVPWVNTASMSICLWPDSSFGESRSRFILYFQCWMAWCRNRAMLRRDISASRRVYQGKENDYLFRPSATGTLCIYLYV